MFLEPLYIYMILYLYSSYRWYNIVYIYTSIYIYIIYVCLIWMYCFKKLYQYLLSIWYLYNTTPHSTPSPKTSIGEDRALDRELCILSSEWKRQAHWKFIEIHWLPRNGNWSQGFIKITYLTEPMNLSINIRQFEIGKLVWTSPFGGIWQNGLMNRQLSGVQNPCWLMIRSVVKYTVLGIVIIHCRGNLVLNQPVFHGMTGWVSEPRNITMLNPLFVVRALLVSFDQ